jgi:hypothetical protein
LKNDYIENIYRIMKTHKITTMITARPETMSFDDYRLLRSYQKQRLKEYKRGRK